MKKPTKIFFSTLLATFFLVTAQAQNCPIFRIGAEYGEKTVLSAKVNDKWNIHQDVGGRWYDYNSRLGTNNGNGFAAYTQKYVGIKPEVSLLNDRLNIYSGLRLTMISENISGIGDNAHFYLREATPQGIEFYRVKTISEKLNYLSIPLEVSYVPIVIQQVAVYGKLGAQLGYKISGKTSLDFVSESMKQHESELIKKAGVENNKFYSEIYAAIGARFISHRKLHFNIEYMLPSRMLTKNNGSITKPTENEGGLQLSVQVPLQLFSGKK